MSNSTPALNQQLCLQIANDLRLLADLHATELTQAYYAKLRDIRFPDVLLLQSTDEVYQLALQQLKDLMDSWPEQLPAELLDELATDYAGIYLNGHLRTYPSESAWLDDENLVCQQPMFQVRQWYQRHGMTVPNWRLMADDHLVNELLFSAWLMEQAATGQQEEMREAAQFMDEHLLRWLLPFGRRVSQRCNTPFYASLGLLTGLYIEQLRDLIARTMDEPRPTAEEIEQRMQPQRPQQAATAQPVQYYPGAAASW
ncbi:MAG: molecular chaperone TorD family protein [Thiolinea sp.]